MNHYESQLELLDYIDNEITRLIKLNKGARTKDDVLAVFNGTLLLMHELRSDLYEARAEQNSVNAIMGKIYSEQLTKGGRRI